MKPRLRGWGGLSLLGKHLLLLQCYNEFYSYKLLTYVRKFVDTSPKNENSESKGICVLLILLETFYLEINSQE